MRKATVLLKNKLRVLAIAYTPTLVNSAPKNVMIATGGIISTR